MAKTKKTKSNQKLKKHASSKKKVKKPKEITDSSTKKIIKRAIVLDEINIEDSTEKITNVLNDLVNKRGYYCIYLTFNRPFQILLNQFKKRRINTQNIYFFDVVTRLFDDADLHKQCSFLDSPNQLDFLLKGIKTRLGLIEGKKSFLMLDNLTNVLNHNTHEQTLKFIHVLTNNLRLARVGGNIIMSPSDTNGNFSNNVFKNFVDAS